MSEQTLEEIMEALQRAAEEQQEATRRYAEEMARLAKESE